MLRVVIILLLLANLGYFAWSQGRLEGLGLAPQDDREPGRMSAQIRPDTLLLLNGPRTESTASSGTGAVNQAPSEPDTACWEASGFSPEQAKSLGAALVDMGLPENQWTFTEVRNTGRWVVFMGRYNPEQMAKKKAELRALKIEFREVALPSTGPGLALGTFSSEEAVQQALKDVAKKGVRSARAAVERPESLSMSLRLPAITEIQRVTVDGLGATLAGKRLQACE